MTEDEKVIQYSKFILLDFGDNLLDVFHSSGVLSANVFSSERREELVSAEVSSFSPDWFLGVWNTIEEIVETKVRFRAEFGDNIPEDVLREESMKLALKVLPEGENDASA